MTRRGQIDIQTLVPIQWAEYKTIRLRALKSEPQAFSSPYEKEAAHTDEAWQQKLHESGKGKSWVFFARDTGGKLVGMVGGYRDDADFQNKSAQIWGMYVDHHMRGKGIAKALMTTVLRKFASVAGIRKAILEVNTDQKIAGKLYGLFGFTVTQTYTMVLGDGKEHQISKMERPLPF